MGSGKQGTPTPLILIVDDEKAIRESVRNYLEDYDFSVIEAGNGRAGLEMFEKNNPDLVMVDLRMPEVDGLEVLANVTKRYPDIPVIIMSGTGVIGDAVEALRLGAWNYLLKPVEDLSVLKHAVENALERSRLLTQNRVYQEHLEIEVTRRTREVEKTAHELRQSEEKYRSIFENLQDVYYEITMDGIITEISPSICAVSKYTREEIINTCLWEIYTMEGERVRLMDALLQHGQVTDYEVHLEDKDGTIVPCSVAARLQLDSRNLPVKICGTIRDISERKRAEEEHEKLLGQLNQAQKMEAIASLTGGIAHDFNNLLTVINGHAEIAQRKLSKNLSIEKDLHAILMAGRRAENLTRQLLAFSRKQIHKPKVIDINNVIYDMEKMLRRLIGEDIVMELHFSNDVPPIKADPGQIEQIFMNLVVNARDAVMDQKDQTAEKKIVIETARVNLNESWVEEHPGSCRGWHALVIVSDSGIGMDEETKNKIFEPFFTTKDKGKGTGLGMSTVYGIVKQNGGCIYVYSEPGQGSIFRIYWPTTEEPVTAELKESTEPKKEMEQGKETILLVEDDDAVRNFAGDTLRELGYTVHEASNGQEALEMVKEKKLTLDLLLTDLIMPKMNGKVLSEKLSHLQPSLAVIYASGYTDNHIIHRYELEQDIHFMQKPYALKALAKKVREVLDENSLKRMESLKT
jgi:two-component system, cell cycle sensor histidine kinase and response regulator CckA